jgi:predicted HicB family RNase H-like nuclease
MYYKGYRATFHYNPNTKGYEGRVSNLKYNEIRFSSALTPDALKTEFHKVIDEYLSECKEKNYKPEQPNR